MKINILTEKYDWILARAAKELLPLEGFEVSINDREGVADIDYYLPYLLFKQKNKNKQVGFFTHLEHSVRLDRDVERKIKKFYAHAKLFDYCIAISERTRQQLKRKCPVIKIGSQFSKPITFGVCGKVHSSGRKNEQFIANLVRDGFKLLAWGEGWPCEILSNTQKGLKLFYETIDYLIVPSSIEGGPVPVLEAISLGVPVIAPDVGWCWDFPVIQYEKNNYESLKRVVVGLTSVPSWNDWREAHADFFRRVLEGAS